MKIPSNIELHVTTKKPHQMRYKTAGDWFDPKKKETGVVFHVNVADTGNPDYNFLVAIHELVEQYLCVKKGISEERVNEYDIKHIEEHCDDPGQHEKSPYNKEHQTATDIESSLSLALDVDWIAYEEAIDKALEKYTENKKKVTSK